MHLRLIRVRNQPEATGGRQARLGGLVDPTNVLGHNPWRIGLARR